MEATIRVIRGESYTYYGAWVVRVRRGLRDISHFLFLKYLDYLFIFNEWRLISIFDRLREYISRLSFTEERAILIGGFVFRQLNNEVQYRGTVT